jgi:rsbT co-antagonist protein RsbR
VTLTPVTLPTGRVLLVVWHELTEIRRREAELRAQIAVIDRQRAEIQRLSMPVLAVWDGVVMIPVLGALDAGAAAQLAGAALEAAARHRARAVILDLTGLAGADEDTAAHLVRALRGVELLGARGLVVGISPALARALVAAGAALPRVRVLASLRDAVELCVRGDAL